MRILKLKCESSIFRPLIDFLETNLSCTYKNEDDQAVLMAGEEDRFRTNSQQLYFMVIRKKDADLFIDLVCGGGGGGLFSISWGSEGAFINKAERLITGFCKDNNVMVTRI